MFELYIGGCISSLLCLFSLNFAIQRYNHDKWDITDYYVFGLFVVGCFLWPAFIPYITYKLTYRKG